MEKTITYQSCRIYYRVLGEGKPVVLIHGFGEDGEIWNAQAAHLQNDFRLIIPDLPGSGQSEMTPDMSIEGMAEVIKTILDQELRDSTGNLEKTTGPCSMFGHSMGGYITLSFAEKYPQFLSAFGLVHSSAYPDSDEKKQTRAKSMVFMQKNGGYQFLKTSIPGLFHLPPGSITSKKYMLDLVEKGRNFKTEALLRYYEAMRDRPNRTDVLKKFEGPILFIIGVYDIAAPFREGLQQSYLPRQSHIHILRSSAHEGMLEEIEKTNEILFRFLKMVHHSQDS